MSSTLGTLFSITTFGESHGPALGVVIDGCPAGIRLDRAAIQRELDRRRPGQSHLTTPRKEEDEFEVLSGLYEGVTLGTPLAFLIRNSDVKSGDYQRWATTYRPSHADYTYHAKYGHRTPLGGGRASARETVGRVIAGAVAGQILKEELGVETVAWLESAGEIRSSAHQAPPLTREEVDRSPVRCPDPAASERIVRMIEEIKSEGDSVGGTVGVIVRNLPPGLGDPVFRKLEADLAAACLSIPACKGFESGSGFEGAESRGSLHNDLFYREESSPFTPPESFQSPLYDVPSVATHTNRSGGIQGGISNGMPLLMRLAFKPTATIRKDQTTLNEEGEEVSLKAGGRHDPCVVPRAIPIVESMVNLVLVDAYLRQRAMQPHWWVRYSSRT